MKRAAKLRLLMSLTAAVWTCALFALYSRGRLAAKAPASVILRSRPHVVRISVNGRALEEGAWLETPYRLNLPPGRSRLKLWRDGFVTTRLDIEADSGETLKMDDITLMKRPGAIFGRVQLGTSTDGVSYHFEVNDGMVRGETPVLVDELVVGKHLLTVYPAWPSHEGRVRCRFTATSEDETEEAPLIRIRKGTRKDPNKEPPLRLLGCDKVAASDSDGASKRKKTTKPDAPSSSHLDGKDASAAGEAPAPSPKDAAGDSSPKSR